jgi:hypothetical protein
MSENALWALPRRSVIESHATLDPAPQNAI